jgi:N-acyl-D-amino-acid deacylase
MSRTDVACASDGQAFALSTLKTKVHPRNTNAFPCFLRTVREKKLMPIEDAIYKITRLPAALMGLGDKIGSLAPGLSADLVVFDYEAIADKGTWQEPWLAPVGIDYVLVNGEIAFGDGRVTEKRPGRFYRA